MKKHNIYVGLDVHAHSISVAVAPAGSGEVRSLGNIPYDIAALRRCLKKAGDLSRMKVCYEAGPCGYGLYWQLTELGVECIVVAPSLIPKKPGDRVKTDRRDAEKLARLLRAGELTAVWVPDPAHEALRDLVRARVACRCDRRRAQQRVEKFLLRHGLRAPLAAKGKNAGKKAVKAFSLRYMTWLASLTFEHEAARLAFEDYRTEVIHQNTRLARLDNQITEAINKAPAQLRALVEALQALRGVAQTTAATLAIEIGDFSRFSKPTQLMAWAGLVPSEYSSGGPGKARRFGITKTGNSYVRHVLGEAAWIYQRASAGSKAVSQRRARTSAAVTAIAEKADQRLCKRYARLRAAEKPINKVTTAVARELLGFVWAIARETQTQSTARSSAWQKLQEAA